MIGVHGRPLLTEQRQRADEDAGGNVAVTGISTRPEAQGTPARTGAESGDSGRDERRSGGTGQRSGEQSPRRKGAESSPEDPSPSGVDHLSEKSDPPRFRAAPTPPKSPYSSSSTTTTADSRGLFRANVARRRMDRVRCTLFGVSRVRSGVSWTGRRRVAGSGTTLRRGPGRPRAASSRLGSRRSRSEVVDLRAPCDGLVSAGFRRVNVRARSRRRSSSGG